jgi:4'-phosphopantetheinyl transferase
MSVLWFERSSCEIPSHNDWLSPGELNHLNELRFPKRRADWRLGRWTAKCAVSSVSSDPLALADISIRAAPSGAPVVWIRGDPAPWRISLSHRAGIACCAISPDPIALGCDIELVEPRSPAFVSDYFTPAERSLITRNGNAEATRLTALLWSAKESALKALGVGLRADTRSVFVTDLHESNHLPSPGRVWKPLRVQCASGNLDGAWHLSGELVRTVVLGR